MSFDASWSPTAQRWPLADHSTFVPLDGLASLHLQQLGEGPVALLIHGTGASSHSWAPLATRLAPHLRLVMPDLPGHGFTALPAELSGLSLARMAESLARLLDRLGVTPALVVGHSAGAAIAACLLLEHGLPVRGYIGLDPALDFALRPASIPGWSVVTDLVSRPGVAALAARVAGHPSRIARLIGEISRGIPPEQLRCYQALAAHPPHVRAALGMMARWDLSALQRRLPSLPCPALLLAGERDPWFPPRQVTAAARRFLPDARVTVVAGTGHLTQEEAPDETAALILDFARQAGIVA